MELFTDEFDMQTSYFGEVLNNKYANGDVIARELSHYEGFESIRFKTKEEVRNFLATYGNLFPTDVPKADTLKTLSHREIKEAKERAIEAEKDRLKRIEDNKIQYRQQLEMQRHLDSLFGKRTSRKDIEDAMKVFENAADTVQDRMIYEKIMERINLMDSVAKSNKNKGQGELMRGGLDTAASIVATIQNDTITSDSAGHYVEFDLILQTEYNKTR